MATRNHISRVNRSKRRAQASYDRLSRWYDQIAASEAQFRQVGLDLLAPQAGETILEIGSGTGQALAVMAPLVGDGGRIVGIELSGGMLQQAKRCVPHKEVAVHLVQGDGAHIPVQSACCDAAFICFTLELFDTPEIPLVLAGIRRSLVKNGRLCVVALAKTDALTVHGYEWAHRTWPTWVDCRPIFTVKSLQDAGFQIRTHARQKMWGLPVDIVLASTGA